MLSAAPRNISSGYLSQGLNKDVVVAWCWGQIGYFLIQHLCVFRPPGFYKVESPTERYFGCFDCRVDLDSDRSVLCLWNCIIYIFAAGVMDVPTDKAIIGVITSLSNFAVERARELGIVEK